MRMKAKRTLLCLLCAIWFPVAVSAASVSASDSPLRSAFPAYTYDVWGNAVACPDPYTTVRRVNGLSVGTGDFQNVNDIFADSFDRVYVAVSGSSPESNQILVFDAELNFLHAAQECAQADGTMLAFEEPMGLFVTEEQEIYLADGKSKRVLHMDSEFRLIRVIEAPSSSSSQILDADFYGRYSPAKLAVDATGRIHVVATNINEGIVEFDSNGKFVGFLAAGKVDYNALELLWRRFSTKAQRERMTDFVPIEYNNIDLDEDGFLFVTLANVNGDTVKAEIEAGNWSEQGALVRRLNLLGSDILRRNGYGPPIGDIEVPQSTETAYTGISKMVDVACGAYGQYSVVDGNRRHIFTYDSDGCLLYAFNGPDVSAGGLNIPSAIARRGEFLYVADNGAKSLILYKQTAFARTLDEAIRAEREENTTQAGTHWETVLAMNPNYDMAYTALGKLAYQQKDYTRAMAYFEKSSNQSWYSKAFKQQRAILIDRWFGWAALAVAAPVTVGWRLLRKRKNRGTRNAD